MSQNCKKILIVDDDLSHLETLKDALEESEFQVVTLSNPKEANELIKNNYFSVVLSDLMMPEIDGLTLLGNVKDISPATQRFLMTAVSPSNLPKETFDIVSKVFHKPFNMEDLVAVLEPHLI